VPAVANILYVANALDVAVGNPAVSVISDLPVVLKNQLKHLIRDCRTVTFACWWTIIIISIDDQLRTLDKEHFRFVLFRTELRN
jgi:hypothetical protein